MIVTPIKTHRIGEGEDLTAIVNRYIKKIEEKTVIVITSKVVARCEGRVVSKKNLNKDKLVKQEADYYTGYKNKKYDMRLTIKNNLLIPQAGIDESNGAQKMILWPKEPQGSANKIRQHLSQQHKIKNVGVIISDSTTRPLRWGVTGVYLAFSGIEPLRDYRGKPDLFGRPLQATQANIADALAGAAAFVMGEGDESTPMAIISQLNNVNFVSHNPTVSQLRNLKINRKDDLYGSILEKVKWYKGGHGNTS